MGKSNIKEPNVGKMPQDDQQRGTPDHGAEDSATGTQSGVPADKATVDPHSEEGKRRRESAERAER